MTQKDKTQTDIDALVAAADALAEAIESYECAESAATDTASPDDYEFVFECWDAVVATRETYRAAREAVRNGTPPAFATSA